MGKTKGSSGRGDIPKIGGSHAPKHMRTNGCVTITAPLPTLYLPHVTRTLEHTYVHICAHTSIHSRTHTCTRIHAPRVYTHPCTRAHACAHTSVHSCTHMGTHIHALMYTCTHIFCPFVASGPLAWRINYCNHGGGSLGSGPIFLDLPPSMHCFPTPALAMGHIG